MITTKRLLFDYPEGDSFAFQTLPLKKKALAYFGAIGHRENYLAPSLCGLLPQKWRNIHDGTDVTALNRKALDLFRGQNIGVIFQHYHYIKSPR